MRHAKTRKQAYLRKCAAMRAAKDRKRIERNASECTAWPLVASRLLCVHASPDGRTMAIRAYGCASAWYRCGSERAVRGAMARLIFGHANGSCPRTKTWTVGRVRGPR